MSVTFDNPNLIANAGLILPGTLAQHLEVQRIIDARVDLSGRLGGANTGIKAMTVLSALLAGAEWIDDVDVLRAGASGAVCGHELRAPSTIGTWLWTFTWGHARPARRRRRCRARPRVGGRARPGRPHRGGHHRIWTPATAAPTGWRS